MNIEYDTGVYYRFRGKKSSGVSFETISIPLYAASGSTRTPVLCIEPGVPIDVQAIQHCNDTKYTIYKEPKTNA
ncbi:MAG: hypothetical protein ACLTXM_16725 [Enterococcus sp.]